MQTPKNSAEVALALVAKARQWGIPVRLRVSKVSHSDSRYVIFYPDTVAEKTVRISSHRPGDDQGDGAPRL